MQVWNLSHSFFIFVFHLCFHTMHLHPRPGSNLEGLLAITGIRFVVLWSRGPWWPLWGSSWGVLFTMHSCATPCTATHYHSFIWGVGIGFTIILLFCMYAQPSKEGAKYLMKDQSLFSAYFKWQYDASPTAAPNTSNIGHIGQCSNVFFI